MKMSLTSTKSQESLNHVKEKKKMKSSWPLNPAAPAGTCNLLNYTETLTHLSQFYIPILIHL